MFSKKNKVRKIVDKIVGQDAIMDIHEILQPLYNDNDKSLTQCELDFCRIEELECEVNSGGFESYFYYSYGDHANETVDALNKIGSVKFKRILLDAISVFGDVGLIKSTSDRSDLIDESNEKYAEKWNVLDNEFCKYEEDIHGLLLEYVKNNIDKFR